MARAALEPAKISDFCGRPHRLARKLYDQRGHHIIWMTGAIEIINRDNQLAASGTKGKAVSGKTGS
jgi:hypothetical protein